MCHFITKGVVCVRFDRSGKTFPVTESDESAFLVQAAHTTKIAWGSPPLDWIPKRLATAS